MPFALKFLVHFSSLSMNIKPIFLHLCHTFTSNYVWLLFWSSLAAYVATLYLTSRQRKIYMVDFACYKPSPASICTIETFMNMSKRTGFFHDESLSFQKKILDASGYGQKTYVPASLLEATLPELGFNAARMETERVLIGVIDEILEKTKVKTEDIGILIMNNSVFNPEPSLSAIVVNHYKLRENILSYNLGGMGCSAGLLSIDLAKSLLQVHPRSYALVVSTETLNEGLYFGNNRSMLVSNCLFRLGGAAVLLSNHSSDHFRSKYHISYTVRTHKGAQDNCYNSVIQREDETNKIGIALSKDIMNHTGEALKANITLLGKSILPFSEQLKFLANLTAKKLLKIRIKPYTPNFKLAFKHFCIHTGGKAVHDALQKQLELDDYLMEPSRMTLYRFGNTSSSSVWYELAYLEAKGRIKRGDRVWQIAFGSGFKCVSAVCYALRNIDAGEEKNPWKDEIIEFPINVT